MGGIQYAMGCRKDPAVSDERPPTVLVDEQHPRFTLSFKEGDQRGEFANLGWLAIDNHEAGWGRGRLGPGGAEQSQGYQDCR